SDQAGIVKIGRRALPSGLGGTELGTARGDILAPAALDHQRQRLPSFSELRLCPLAVGDGLIPQVPADGARLHQQAPPAVVAFGISSDGGGGGNARPRLADVLAAVAGLQFLELCAGLL